MRILIAAFVILCLAACQSEPKDPILEELNKYAKELELQPSAERAASYLSASNKYIVNHLDDYAVIKPYLTKSLELTKEYGMIDRSPSYLIPLIQNEKENKEYILQMGDVMINLNKVHASNVIYTQLGKKYSNDPEVLKRMALVDSVAQVQPDYMSYLFDQIMVKPDEVGFNKRAALRYVDAAEAYSYASPEKKKETAEYLYKGAEVARSMRSFPKAMSLYDRILKEYPNFDKAGTVFFIKGFLLEQEYKKVDEAKVIYEEFLKKYPNHDMAGSVKILLENLGKSEEEMLEAIQKNRK